MTDKQKQAELKVAELIVLSRRALALHIELEQSMKYQRSTHMVDNNRNFPGKQFFLIEKSSKKIICDGTKSILNKYIKRRGIDTDDIFQYEFLTR